MSKREDRPVSLFAIRAADTLATEVIRLVKAGRLDARSPAADAALGYASIRFGNHDPIHDLLKHVEALNSDPPPQA